MKDKKFYQSKKFVYALATFLAALVVWLMPMIVDMQQEQIDMLNTMLPGVLAVGIALIAGHSATDIIAIWVNGVQAKPVKEAVQDLVEAIPLGER